MLMKPLVDNVRAVLFDLDGTLVDTNIDFPLMKAQMIELALEHGLSDSSLAEMDILAIVDTATESLTANGKHSEATNLRSRAMAILEEIELRHASQTQEIPHAREGVAELRARGIGIGIVTRNCRAASEISLDIAGIQPDVMICREDSIKHKPHPDPLYMALDALSARPKESIMVGDHLMDIRSGKAAGMKTIGFLREDRPEGFFDLVGPDLIARDLLEVIGAIIHPDR